MNVDQLRQRFQTPGAALSGRLAAGIGDVLASMGVVAAAAGGDADLPFVGTPVPVSDGTTAGLVGTLTYRSQDWAFELTGRPILDAVEVDRSLFTLTLTRPLADRRDWTIGAGFADLPDSLAADDDSGLLSDIPGGVIARVVLREPVLVATNTAVAGDMPDVRLTALLPPQPMLARYATLVGVDPLPITGSIRFVTTAEGPRPRLDLIATTGQTVALAGVRFGAIGLQLVTAARFGQPDTDVESLILLRATAQVPALGRGVTFSMPLLQGDFVWRWHAHFEPPLTLSAGLATIEALLPGANLSDYPLPAGLGPIDTFGLSQLELGIRPGFGAALPQLDYAALELATTEPWNTPLAFVSLDSVRLRWMHFLNGDGPAFGSIDGHMTLGAKKGGSIGPGDQQRSASTGVGVDASIELPGFAFSAALSDPVALADLTPGRFLLSHYDAGSPELDAQNLTITRLAFAGNITDKRYQVEAALAGVWKIETERADFSLDEITLNIATRASKLAGELTATTSVTVPLSDGTTSSFRLWTSAAYPGTGHWAFESRLIEPLRATELVAGFLGVEPPSWVPAVTVTAFRAAYSTAPGNPYSVTAALTAMVDREVLGETLNLAFGIGIEVRDNGATTRGTLHCAIAVADFEVTGALLLADRQPTWTFSIGWKGVKLVAIARPATGAGDTHQVLALRLQGLTLGTIVEYFAGLANPNANYRLAPPWDFLNAIDLGRFELVFDRKHETVSLSYDLGIQLAFGGVTKVGVIYDRKGGEGSVRFLVEGTLFGETFEGADALEWDALRDNPPPIPGKGQALFDLAYFGLGQRVAPTIPGQRLDSIAVVIDAMRRQMIEPTDPAALPIGAGHPLRFDPASQWLFGLDCTIMDTVALKIVLHDPDLYGVLVELRGPKAQSLAGMSFELFYQKVAADVGVFRARLRIPDAFRQLQLGAASFTLGTIGVDIFTNGQFRVDLGFPRGHDFTDSFAVELLYFNGLGGMYLGLLDGATSERTPRVTNGSFSPVVELGIGLAVGAGRTFRKGVLNATVIADVVVILEGVLGWFNPRDPAAPNALYYWAQGTAGVVGKVHGTVDLSVVGIAFTLEIGAYATLTLEARQASHITFDVSARVEASVRIWFVTLHFHHEVRFTVDLEFGTASTPPWTLDRAQQHRLTGSVYSPMRSRGRASAAIGRQAFIDRRRRLTGAHASSTGWHLSFDPNARVFADGLPRGIPLTMVPLFTAADLPLEPAVAEAGTATSQVAFLLTAATATAPDADGVTDSRVAVADGDPANTPFGLIVEAMVRWTLDAAHDPDAAGTLVTRGMLLAIIDQLALPEAAREAFSLDRLGDFFRGNLHFGVTAPPADGATAEHAAVPFPLPPNLIWLWADPSGLSDIEDKRVFGMHQPVGPEYEQELRRYFARLDPRPPADRPDPPIRRAERSDKMPETLASVVFRDYFLMIARTAMQSAADLLAAFPVALDTPASLRAIATRFPAIVTDWQGRAGDTLDTIAATYGLSASELSMLNPDLTVPEPGQTVPIRLGIGIHAVAESAAAHPVTKDNIVAIATPDTPILAEARAEDTLAGIADRWLVPDRTGWLASADLARTQRLLRAGASIDLATFRYATPIAIAPDWAAAFFYVRLAGGVLDEESAPGLGWYASTIVAMNKGMPDLTPGTPLTVPAGLADHDRTRTWTVQVGDTLESVAATLALAFAPTPPLLGWQAAYHRVNPDGRFDAFPEQAALVVQADETLATLAARLTLAHDDPLFIARVEHAAILRPFAEIAIPGARVMTAANETLLVLAQRVGLSLADFAERVADVPDLIAASFEPLTIRDVPVLDREALVAALHRPAVASSIAGQASRFMLGGLRIPTPEPDADGVIRATGPMAGLYELIGQQLAVPAPAAVAEDTERFELTIGKADEAPWLSLYPYRGSGAGEPFGQIRLVLTERDLRDQAIDTVLRPDFRDGPRAIASARTDPVHHQLGQVIRWRTGTVSADAAVPSLWPLPAELMATASSGVSSAEWQLRQLPAPAPPGTMEQPIRDWSFATLIDVAVQRVPGDRSRVELLGAGTADRQRLARLLAALGLIAPDGRGAPVAPVAEDATLAVTVGWTLPPGPGVTHGLTSTPLDPTASFVVKSNLSTETRRGIVEGVTRGAVLHDYVATFAQDERASLLLMIWECSTIGGGGFWMRLADPGGGPLLPDAIFDQDGRATLSLIVTSTAAAPERRLRDFDNVAIIGDGVDPGSVVVHVVAAADGPTVVRPSVAAGDVGFTLDLGRPDLADLSRQSRTRSLFSLVGYGVVEDQVRHEAMPIGPQASGTDQTGRSDRWTFARTISAARFFASRVPQGPGLPPHTEDPYAGIGDTMHVDLWFNDVLGNRTAHGTGLPLPMLYHDPLVAPGGWPATMLDYEVSGVGSASLTVGIAYRGGVVQPGGSEVGAAAALRASTQADRFAALWYQLSQPDITAAVTTTLHQNSQGEPVPLPIAINPLRDHLTSCWRYAHAVARGESAYARAIDDVVLTPATVVARYGVGYAALAATNVEAALDRLFADPTLLVPRFVPSDGSRSIAELVPTADPAAIIAQPHNRELSLREGVAITTPQRIVAIPIPPPGEVTSCVAELVKAMGCTLEDLAVSNAATANLTAPGATFACRGFVVEVDRTQSPTASLNGVRDTFAANGIAVTVAELLRENGQVEGLLQAGQPLLLTTYIAAPDETLAANGSGFDAAVLAASNVATRGLFAAGAPILTGFDTVAVSGTTLGRLALERGVRPADVLASNPGRTMRDAAVLLPGRLVLPDDITSAHRVPAAAQTPDAIAAAFDRSAGAILAANLGMPGLLQAGVTLQAAPGEAAHETLAPDTTLACLIDRFAERGVTSSADLLAQANADVAFLRLDARIIVPPADTHVTAALGELTRFADPVFAVRAWLEIARPVASCDPVLAAEPASGVRASRSILPPRRARGADATLLSFAASLEAAVPALRLATGRVQSDISAELWAVAFGFSGIDSVVVKPPVTIAGLSPQPRTFAIRPLSTSPYSRTAQPIRSLMPDGSLGAETTRVYQGVDVEVWAVAFLADLEAVLAGDMASLAVATARNALETILDVKRGLADAIAAGVAPLLADQVGNTTGIDAARAAMRQALLVSLSDGYVDATAIQFDSLVVSAWRPGSARLAGTITAAPLAEAGLTPTISDAKVSLSSGPGVVTAIVQLPDARHQEALTLDLRYRTQHLEYNIVPRYKAYESSDWVSFLRPIGDDIPLVFEMDRAVVPMPLRHHPALPTLIDHMALTDGSGTLADAAQWRYRLRFRHHPAEQDLIGLTMLFNSAPPMQLGVSEVEADVFAALAQYAEVAAELRSLLAGFGSADPMARANADTALATFATMARTVESAWAAHWIATPMVRTAAPAGLAAGYGMTVTIEDESYARVTLTRDATARTIDWPDLHWEPHDGLALPLTTTDTDDTTRIFGLKFGAGMPVPSASDAQVWTLTSPALHAVAIQNATASIAVERNTHLIHASHLAEASLASALARTEVATNPAFVFRAPEARFGDAVTPLITVTTPIPLDSWSVDGLKPVLATLFGNGDASGVASLTVGYEYLVVPGDVPIHTTIPVLTRPAGPFGADQVQALIDATARWHETVGPNPVDGRWVLALTIYAEQGDTLRPLIEVQSLRASASAPPARPHPPYGIYRTAIGYGGTWFDESHPVEISAAGVSIAGVPVTGVRMTADTLEFTDQADATRDGKPWAGRLVFTGTDCSGWCQFPGEGPVDWRGTRS